MNFSVITVNGGPNAIANAQYQIVGAVCQLAALSKCHAGVALFSTIDRLRMPIKLDQIKVFFSDFDQCMGYVTWAYVTPEVEARLIADPTSTLHEFEWNEGNRLWIMDFLAPKGSIEHIMRNMRDVLFLDSETLSYFRVKNGRRICKQISRTDPTRFFRVAIDPMSAKNR
jgi:hemolysin-activating ACP:hemolysin acyltransferase